MRKAAVRIGVFCLYIQLLFMSVAAADAAQVTVDGVLLPEPLLRGVAAGKTYRVEVELPG